MEDMLQGRAPNDHLWLQFWKSNAMFWCDYCKVWMNDNPATKATHENGLKHKDMVARSKPLDNFPGNHDAWRWIDCVQHGILEIHSIHTVLDSALPVNIILCTDVYCVMRWLHVCCVTSELRQMRQKQDQEKRDLVESQRSMSSIEAAAQRQYQADLKAAEESQKQRLGEWVSPRCDVSHCKAQYQGHL